MRIAIGDVGRVGNNQVESFASQIFKPVALAKINRCAEPAGIVAGHRNCLKRQVDRSNLRRRAFQGQRNGDDAGAGAEIKDSRRRHTVQLFQRQFDQNFGFRARNQYIGRDLENPAAEFRLADQIGQRFAGGAALDPLQKLGVGRRNHRRLRPRQQVGMRATGGVLQQQTGIEPVDFLPGCGQRGKQGHFQFCSASSASISA
jgi:hypothetical protein